MSNLDTLVFSVWMSLEILAIFISIAGNIIVIYAMSSEKWLRKKSSYFVISIAAADLLISISVIFLTIERSKQFGSPTKISFNRSYCLWITSFFLAVVTVSVLQLMLVSVDRYLAVCRPVFYHTRTDMFTKIAISLCWITGIIFGFTPLVFDLTGEACNLHILHNIILSAIAGKAFITISCLYFLIFKAFRKQVKVFLAF